MTVLVTGISGFVGSAVAQDLAAHGWRVRGLSRRAPDTSAYEITRADIGDRKSLRYALRGVTAVVHAAGMAHVSRVTHARVAAEIWRVNAEGTRVLAEESARAGVGRLVIVSSIAAVRSTSDTVVDSQTPPDPRNAYGRSKLAGDEAALQVAADSSSDLDVTVLRPPAVYGPTMKGAPRRLFELVWRRVPLPFASVRNRRSFLFVGNLVAWVRAALCQLRNSGGVYPIADESVFSTPEFVQHVARALGVRPRLIDVPVICLLGVARLADGLSELGRVTIAGDAIRAAVSSLEINASSARTALGAPPFSADEALSLTAEWFHRDRGSAHKLSD